MQCHYSARKFNKNKHICIVTGPIPLIMFDWSTIRLSIGTPLENTVWIIMVYRASVCPLCLAYVIGRRSCMAPSTQYPPSADPVMHSFISMPLTLQSPPDSPSRGANLLWTWLLLSAGKERALSIPGRGCAALMCHAICVHWLIVALSSTHSCQHEQPLLELTRLLASVPTIPMNGRGGIEPKLLVPFWSKPISCCIVEADVLCRRMRLLQLYVFGRIFPLFATLH